MTPSPNEPLLALICGSVSRLLAESDGTDDIRLRLSAIAETEYDGSWTTIAARIESLTRLLEIDDPGLQSIIALVVLGHMDPTFSYAYELLSPTSSAAPTVGVAQLVLRDSCFDREMARALSPGGAARERGILMLAESPTWHASAIYVNDNILRYVWGDLGAGPSIKPLIASDVPVLAGAASQSIGRLFREHQVRFVHLSASAGLPGVEVAHAALEELGVERIVLDLTQVEPAAISARITDALIHAGLNELGVVFEFSAETPVPNSVVKLLHSSPVPAIAVGTRLSSTVADTTPQVRCPRTTRDERGAFWTLLFAAYGLSEYAGWIDRLSQYPLTPRLIKKSVMTGFFDARATSVEDLRLAIHEAARANASGTASVTLEVVESTSLDDVSLAPAQRDDLQDFLAHARRRSAESRDSSLRLPPASLLMSGPPGTGKTTCARALSYELGVPLMTVNLSRVVDKYIGETEKKLAEVFDLAEEEDGILFFDEADSLFGARSELKDSKDRFANQQTSYLLQRIESFDGICVLATNLLGNFDRAFVRRLRYVITLSPPEGSARRELWNRSLAKVDHSLGSSEIAHLADVLQLTAAEINSIVWAASVRSGRLGLPIDVDLVARCVAREMTKQGKRVPPMINASASTPRMESRDHV